MSVEPSIDDAELLVSWIIERNPDVATRLAMPKHEQWVSVEISGSTYDYRVTTTAIRDGDVVGTVAEPTLCDCNSEALLGVVDEEIKRALLQLESMPARVTHPEPEPEPLPEPEPTRSRPKPTKLGAGGIIIGSLGILGIGAGITFVAVETQPIKDYSALLHREYRPLGYVSLSMGITALASGATMLVVDLTRCKRKPNAPGCLQNEGPSQRAASSRRIHLSAAVSPRTAGLFIGGRF